MLFFFIVPLWLLCVVLGVGLLFSRRWRYSSSYLILVSTLGLIGSFVLSTAILFLGPKTFTGTGIDNGLVFFGGIVLIGLYIAGIAIGAVLGAWGGLILARKVNARTGL
jgi:hypothetical protein